MTIFKKKATDIQETKKLPMTGKVKKGFRAYCTMVIVGALALGMTTTAYGLLPDIFVEKRRAQRAVDVLFVGTGRAAVDDAFFLKHS